MCVVARITTLRAVLSNIFLKDFFPRKTGESGKTGNISNFEKLTDGKISGTLSIPIGGKESVVKKKTRKKKGN